jgi:hypothetical protein
MRLKALNSDPAYKWLILNVLQLPQAPVLMRIYNAGRGENRPSPLISDKTATEGFFYLTLRCPKEFSPEAIF